jgi:hypothetical protein
MAAFGMDAHFTVPFQRATPNGGGQSSKKTSGVITIPVHALKELDGSYYGFGNMRRQGR